MEASLDKSIPNAYYTDENHFQHEVSEEDNEKCEGVQKGLSSGAFAHSNLLNIPSRSDISEHAIVHFHDYIKNAVQSHYAKTIGE